MKKNPTDKMFLTINEVLNLIDEKFKYVYAGKPKNDHLISSQTWHSYITRFFENLEDIENEQEIEEDLIEKRISKYQKKLKGANKNRRYSIDFVEEIINFNSDLLTKQFNSERKTKIDDVLFNLSKATLNIEDSKIRTVRIIKAEDEMRKNNRYPEVTEELREEIRASFIEMIISELIDNKKLEEDIEQWIVSSELIHGYSYPLEMIEDGKGPIGFKIDRKKYLKKNIIDEIKNS